ncbi:MAG: riboflavin synthase, alpha subunit [Chloroflexi bacterium]|nr:riboflavin synthase, alpha subunit [Chloroflexota bacterium]
MFTGIVEEVGSIRSLAREADSVVLSVSAGVVRDGLRPGDSVSVDGACLTVTGLDAEGFTVGLSPETLRRTSLGAVGEGTRVNLERAVRVGDRLGGHIVQGHVDGVGMLTGLRPEGDSVIVTVEAPESLGRYIVEKGFVAVDGASLTVTARDGFTFSIALVSYSQEHLALADKPVGSQVNIEVDIVAKYVESLLGARLQVTGDS